MMTKLNTLYVLTPNRVDEGHAVSIEYILDDVVRKDQKNTTYTIYLISNNTRHYVKVDIIKPFKKSDTNIIIPTISRSSDPSLDFVENFYNEIPPFGNICVSIPQVELTHLLITFEDKSVQFANDYKWVLTDMSVIRHNVHRHVNNSMGFSDLRLTYPDPRPTYSKSNYNFCSLDLNRLRKMERSEFSEILDDNFKNYVPHVNEMINEYLF